MSTLLKYTPLDKKKVPPKIVLKNLLQHKNLQIPFQKATNVQKQIIQHIITGKSGCFVASTGSGKSYGYVFGILLRFLKRKITGNVVIVLPTKELVEQVYALFKEFRKSKYPKILSMTSKYSEERDIKKLKLNFDIVVTTPGRFKLIKNCALLVLDEVDLLLREGFEIPDKRFFQLICTSATLKSKYCESLNLNIIHLDDNSEKYDLNLFMRREQKAHVVLTLLSKFDQIIIFCSSKARVDEIYDFLKIHQIDEIGAIHGDLDTQLRESNCLSFKRKKLKVLITTDLASRGLNMNSQCIIHYDLSDKDTMIHRRGRCMKNGHIIFFYTLFDLKQLSTTNIYSVGDARTKELNTISENSYDKLKRLIKEEGNGLNIDINNLNVHEYFISNKINCLKNKLKSRIDNFKRKTKEKVNTEYQDQFFIPYK